MSVEFSTNELIDYIESESQEVGGQFRAPGYKAQAIKLMKETFKRRKFKIQSISQTKIKTIISPLYYTKPGLQSWFFYF